MALPPHLRWADPFRLEPTTAASLARALAATPDARSGPRWDNCPAPAPIRQQLRRMTAAQLLADRARRRALGLLERIAAGEAVRPGEPCSSSPTDPPMLAPADPLARLWALLNDPPACRRLIGPPWRPRLTHRPRRLRLLRRAGVLRARR